MIFDFSILNSYLNKEVFIMILTEKFIYNSDLSSNSLNERIILSDNTRLFERTKKYDLFVSHRYIDKEIVLKLVKLFNKANYSVYIDWIDDSQLNRDSITVNTADLLRQRINQSKGLAYIATSNSENSKWCPWELGIADGKKEGKACILPISKHTQEKFIGQEYLCLYPYLTYNESSKDFYIYSQKDHREISSLRNWLNYNHQLSRSLDNISNSLEIMNTSLKIML